MQWLKAAGYKTMPWKNGGGETREIACAQGRDGGFGWRLSMATIAQSGPFSSFTDIDRSIALVKGDGVALDVEGKEVVLDKDAGVYAFDGGAAVSARCLGGVTTDLNMMTRRGDFRHLMQRLCVNGETQLANTADQTFVVFADAAIAHTGNEELAVGAGDTLILLEDQKIWVTMAQKPVTLFMIALWKE
ncbi:MAG: Histidine uptake and utilization protein [Candidatus Tokpelaia hoelldobleri]|uniref:Histidine uptake and utilization protein n=1 Tax=Candidatus Tokpelaia hoelldobleri TaxID=1902579 RepID=A0A1U9JVS1_9HYPH|nr:MAG: Histidine uptake and utilization protein [Candidatus Tokpelaia hoelldoblerii]